MITDSAFSLTFTAVLHQNCTVEFPGVCCLIAAWLQCSAVNLSAFKNASSNDILEACTLRRALLEHCRFFSLPSSSASGSKKKLVQRAVLESWLTNLYPQAVSSNGAKDNTDFDPQESAANDQLPHHHPVMEALLASLMRLDKMSITSLR